MDSWVYMRHQRWRQKKNFFLTGDGRFVFQYFRCLIFIFLYINLILLSRKMFLLVYHPFSILACISTLGNSESCGLGYAKTVYHLHWCSGKTQVSHIYGLKSLKRYMWLFKNASSFPDWLTVACLSVIVAFLFFFFHECIWEKSHGESVFRGRVGKRSVYKSNWSVKGTSIIPTP